MFRRFRRISTIIKKHSCSFHLLTLRWFFLLYVKNIIFPLDINYLIVNYIRKLSYFSPLAIATISILIVTKGNGWIFKRSLPLMIAMVFSSFVWVKVLTIALIVEFQLLEASLLYKLELFNKKSYELSKSFECNHI